MTNYNAINQLDYTLTLLCVNIIMQYVLPKTFSDKFLQSYGYEMDLFVRIQNATFCFCVK